MSDGPSGEAAVDPAVLAHGVGFREDLPIPFDYALAGAAVALVVSFAALGMLWRSPRLGRADAGLPFPLPVSHVLTGPVVRGGLAALGMLMLGNLGLAAFAGRDDALNPTAGAVYVLFWVGLPITSMLLGPLWRVLNPARGLWWLITGAGHLHRVGGRYPRVLGYWPAAGMLLGFVWLELVLPDNTTLQVLRVCIAAYLVVDLLASVYWGRRWFTRGDGFEVYSSLMGRLSVLARRRLDDRLVVRNPLHGLAAAPTGPGLFAVLGVLLGSTGYDSLQSSPWWTNVIVDSPLPAEATETLGLLGMIVLVTGAFVLAATATSRGSAVSPWRAAGQYAHTLIPIVAGYIVAHYWSLLVFVGQETVIRFTDPLGTGADWLGLADRRADQTLLNLTFVAVLQVSAVVVGHVIGVILAHDRALRLSPGRAVPAQIPMVTVMVGYTIGGLSLLFSS